MVKGTGKYEGIKAKGNWAFYPVTDRLGDDDFESQQLP